MSFKYINERYGIRLKRHMVVRYKGKLLYVMSSRNAYVVANDAEGVGLCYHPYDLDYLIDGQWLSGESLRKKYDEGWDRINTLLNAAFDANQHESR